MNGFAVALVSVSYTHLVVGTRVLMGQINGASADSRIAGYRTGVAVGAVSYTHLDVYKRQSLCNSYQLCLR